MDYKIKRHVDLGKEQKSDFFYYGAGKIATLETENFNLQLIEVGKMKLCLNDEKGNLISSNYQDIYNYHIKNDKEYVKAVKNSLLEFDGHNWFEIVATDKQDKHFDLEEAIYGSGDLGDVVDGAIKAMVDLLNDKELVTEIENVAKARLKDTSWILSRVNDYHNFDIGNYNVDVYEDYQKSSLNIYIRDTRSADYKNLDVKTYDLPIDESISSKFQNNRTPTIRDVLKIIKAKSTIEDLKSSCDSLLGKKKHLER